MTTTEEEVAQVKADIQAKRNRLFDLHSEISALQSERIDIQNKMAILHSRLAQLEGAS